MISPFEIYLILQLDTLRSMLHVFTLVLGLIGTIGGILYTVTNAFGSGEHGDKEARAFSQAIKSTVIWLLALFAVNCTLYNTLPSTKTAAAMFIVPAIANNETIQKEASELYSLAKQAITDAVRGDEAPPQPKKSE